MKIHIEQAEFFGFHGVHAHEHHTGHEYLIDLEVEISDPDAHFEDALSETVDYVSLYRMLGEIMEKPVKLIETLAHRILTRTGKQDERILKARVRIKKLRPEIGGEVHATGVELERVYR